MTTCEIVDRFMKHHGYVRVEGDSIEPILPMLMLDIVCDTYDKLVSGMTCRHKVQQAKTAWRDCYRRFNEDFFGCYTNDESILVTDRMDDFEKYVNNEVTMLKIAIMDEMPQNEPFEVRNIVSAVMVCNILAQAAQVYWNRNYRATARRGETNVCISGLVAATHKFANEYHKTKDTANINLNESEAVVRAWDALSLRMARYIEYEKDSGRTASENEQQP